MEVRKEAVYDIEKEFGRAVSWKPNGEFQGVGKQ